MSVESALDIVGSWPRATGRDGLLYAFAISEWVRAMRYTSEERAPGFNVVLRRLGLRPDSEGCEPLDTGFLPA